MTRAEQTDFETIVTGARAAGWLDDEDELHVQRAPPWVMVVCSGPSGLWCSSYPDDARWLYEFLRDVARGARRVARNLADVAP
jgi:hypothetical protein